MQQEISKSPVATISIQNQHIAQNEDVRFVIFDDVGS